MSAENVERSRGAGRKVHERAGGALGAEAICLEITASRTTVNR